MTEPNTERFPSVEDFQYDIAAVLADQWNGVRDPDHHIAAYDMQDEARAVYEEIVAPALDTLRWLHAEAVWHAEHHRAQVETQGLSHALLLNGFRGYADQVDAMARKIREQDEQLALAMDTLGSIWLYVNWHYVSKQLTTEQKELWADAVDEFGDPADRGPKAERWWRDDAPAPAHDEVLTRLREAMRKDEGMADRG